jgi:hypothetical protein
MIFQFVFHNSLVCNDGKRGVRRVVGVREQFDASRRQPWIHTDPVAYLSNAAAAAGPAQSSIIGSD